MGPETTIFAARKILTMDPNRPVATHVAVRDGRILGVGERDQLSGWGPHRLDTRFADKVLMPGLVEGHAHVLEGFVWQHVYLGFYDRRGPDGRIWKGLKSLDEVIARLKTTEAALTDPDRPLIGWGFDPIFLPGRRMVAADLDRVSSGRAVAIIHASFHVMNANSELLRRAGIDASTNVHGVVKGDDGRPTGELLEMAAKFMAYRALGEDVMAAGNSPAVLRRYAQVAQLAGVTTVTDLHSDLSEKTVATYRAVTAEPEFPVRLVPAFRGYGIQEDGVAKLERLRAGNTDKLRFGLVKLIADGSIQGFTGRLKWPGYYNGRPNGIWNIAPEELKGILLPFHKAGFQVHIHVNGDEASEVALDAIEAVLAEAPRRDHRHTLQHCQMADAAQFRRMAALGVAANLFSNHIYYWGDAHYAETMGPDRAERMDAVASAMRCGVAFAIHSDAPITPIGPLFTAWCAVNRLTASGRRLGEGERIGVADALRAITLGAAYTLKMDGEIGSIETGKFADFTVLDADPLAVPEAELKDIGIFGTVLGGRFFASPSAPT